LANQDYIKKLDDGRDAWNTFYKPHPESHVFRDLSGADLSHKNFSGYNFKRANFQNCNMKGTNFEGACLDKVQMHGTAIDKNTKFDNASMQNINANSVNFSGCSMQNVDAKNSSFSHTNFKDADISSSDLSQCNLSYSNFSGALLKNTILRSANLNETIWENTTINDKTNFYLADFTKHDVFNDKSDQINFVGIRRLFDWRTIRQFGRLPVFEFSWAVMLIALLIINTIGFLNHTKFIQVSIKYPIPYPDQLILTLIGSFFLVIGTTIYKLRCPKRVQEFSETQWVEEHEKARHFYLIECLRYPLSQIISAFFLLLGAGLSLYVVLFRTYIAASYIIG